MFLRKKSKATSMTISPFDLKKKYQKYDHSTLVETCAALDFFHDHYKERYQKLRERIQHLEKTSVTYNPCADYKRFIIEEAQEARDAIKREPHFWTVFKPGGISTKMHRSYEEAVKEAKRLAEKQPRDQFFVMEVKSRHEAVPVPQYKHVDEYYG